MVRRLGLVIVAAVALLGGLLAAPAVAEPGGVTNVSAPEVSGTAAYGSTLTASPGGWDAAEVTPSYQWLRDGVAIDGATATTYRTVGDDVDHAVSVRVDVVSADGATGSATSAAVTVRPATLRMTGRPSVTGTMRYGHTVTAWPGHWQPSGVTVSYQWMRGTTPISGARSRTYTFRPTDVGHGVWVRTTVRRAHHTTQVVRSVHRAGGLVGHRRDVRRTVTYRVVRKGSSASSLSTFRRQAAETLRDARGWRGAGIRFKEVRSGGQFTLVLARASQVPRYSSGCSATYSCRVGRYVIINETRWRTATSTWRKDGRSVRDYRHMVVNHETGHWLGKGHARCSSRGALAPVMMQQSKGLKGCRANPWPKRGELGVPRYGWKAP
ncbi:MAG: DUF3152 domain-containing protein [Aeromicrobium erythreum]